MDGVWPLSFVLRFTRRPQSVSLVVHFLPCFQHILAATVRDRPCPVRRLVSVLLAAPHRTVISPLARVSLLARGAWHSFSVVLLILVRLLWLGGSVGDVTPPSPSPVGVRQPVVSPAQRWWAPSPPPPPPGCVRRRCFPLRTVLWPFFVVTTLPRLRAAPVVSPARRWCAPSFLPPITRPCLCAAQSGVPSTAVVYPLSPTTTPQLCACEQRWHSLVYRRCSLLRLSVSPGERGIEYEWRR